MTTANTPSSASTVTPDTPSQPGGSEVGANPPANEPSVSGDVQTFKSTFDTALASLQPSLLNLPPKDSARHLKVGATERQVIAIAITMLRSDPTLSVTSADDVQAMVDDESACSLLSRDLGNAMVQVSNTGRLRLESASKAVSEVVSVARKRATEDTTLAADVASIDALRARGTRVESAARVALADQQTATKANARAAKATQKSATATARANALQHGTGDAVITLPAPSAPSTAAPASGATAGTPASATIR